MRQLVVTVRADEVELASDALWGLGVVAVEEREGEDDVVELWTSLGDDARDSDVLLPQPWLFRFEEVDEAIADTWRQFAEPVWVEADLVVRPAWVPFEAPVAVTVVHIEPGATFGMGDHPTTILSLRSLRRLVRPDSLVLDVGCGSGVLAIGACVMGAAAAVGIDIAPAAVPVTRANALANGVGDRIEASTTDLADVDGSYSIVVANILAPALVALADDLRRVVADGGALVVSGVLATAHEHVLAALEPLRVVATDEMDGWAAITLR
ncbi:MAG TPA: 50S ribosomal protein L11 methyltransferase [Ilumatobacteraceae bacterium]|nr:50S ribosomal protein L11 methyltransferase [Ilumatobacteraceae bacterium]HRB03895.1 50S ribosomal protein L11 methyltransferase [Ilumatobacteraceae bacterium]